MPPVKAGPADSRYPDLVARGANSRFRGTPEHAHVVATTEQVVAAVAEAVAAGKRIAVRSGGHCFADFVDNADTQVVIDLATMTNVYFDPERRAFAVEPGALLGDVYRRLFLGWGVTLPVGSCVEVAAGGHILGGGNFGIVTRYWLRSPTAGRGAGLRGGLAVGHARPRLVHPARRPARRVAPGQQRTGRSGNALHNGLLLLGSAFGAVDPTATAVAQRDSVLKVIYLGSWAAPDEDDGYVRWLLRDLYAKVYAGTGRVPAPDDRNGGSFINYPDPDLADPVHNPSVVAWVGPEGRVPARAVGAAAVVRYSSMFSR